MGRDRNVRGCSGLSVADSGTGQCGKWTREEKELEIRDKVRDKALTFDVKRQFGTTAYF